jgi:hypothetical protein
MLFDRPRSKTACGGMVIRAVKTGESGLKRAEGGNISLQFKEDFGIIF